MDGCYKYFLSGMTLVFPLALLEVVIIVDHQIWTIDENSEAEPYNKPNSWISIEFCPQKQWKNSPGQEVSWIITIWSHNFIWSQHLGWSCCKSALEVQEIANILSQKISKLYSHEHSNFIIEAQELWISFYLYQNVCKMYDCIPKSQLILQCTWLFSQQKYMEEGFHFACACN